MVVIGNAFRFCKKPREEIFKLRIDFVYVLDLLQDLYLVQTLMECDLSRLLRSQKLSDDHICYFTYQAIQFLWRQLQKWKTKIAHVCDRSALTQLPNEHTQI